MIRYGVEALRVLRGGRLSREALRKLQTRRLQALVGHAGRHVPFYRDLYRNAGVDIARIRGPEDLHLLPQVTKADLRAAGPKARITEGLDPEFLLQRHTSGTTGEPFLVLMHSREYALRGLVNIRTLRAAGRRTTDRLVYLGPRRRRDQRLHQRLGILPSHHVDMRLSPTDQADGLRRLRPHALWAYPSRVRVLEANLGESIASVVRPRILVTSADHFQPGERRRLASELGAEPFDFYGCIEVGRIAAECREHNGLHIQSDHVLLEAPYDRPGPVLVTSLTALAVPIIRYRLGDLGLLTDDRCRCGSPFPLLRQLSGRETDAIHLPGGVVSPGELAVTMREVPWLRRFQTAQVEPARLRVEIVPDGEPGPEQLESLRSAVLTALGSAAAGVTVEIHTRDSFPADGEKLRDFVPYRG